MGDDTKMLFAFCVLLGVLIGTAAFALMITGDGVEYEVACQNADKSTITIFPGTWHDMKLDTESGTAVVMLTNYQNGEKLYRKLAESETCYTIQQ